jgi:hypothetical protein
MVLAGGRLHPRGRRSGRKVFACSSTSLRHPKSSRSCSSTSLHRPKSSPPFEGEKRAWRQGPGGETCDWIRGSRAGRWGCLDQNLARGEEMLGDGRARWQGEVGIEGGISSEGVCCLHGRAGCRRNGDGTQRRPDETNPHPSVRARR